MAPFTPFITERVWQDLYCTTASVPCSVHLTRWPVADADLVDEVLARQVGVVRSIVELGRAARADTGVRGRQPLRQAVIPTRSFELLDDALRVEIAEELNVRTVRSSASAEVVVDHRVTPDFRHLGRRFGPLTPRVAAAVEAADAAALVRALATADAFSVTVDDAEVVLTGDDVTVTEIPAPGWAVASSGDGTVALDLQLDGELVRAGLAREAVRALQEGRKRFGFEVVDRVHVRWSGSDELAEVIDEHRDLVMDVVSAASMVREASTSPPADDRLGLAFALDLAPPAPSVATGTRENGSDGRGERP